MSFNPFAAVAQETTEIVSSVRRKGIPASALYHAIIKAAFIIPNSRRPADQDLVLRVEFADGYEHAITGTVLRNGSPKALNKANVMELLWGYTTATHIIGAATDGKTLVELFPECQRKIVKIFNFDTRTDVDTEVDMLMPLIGREVLLGMQRKISNRQTQDESGGWVNLPESRESLVFGCAGSVTTKCTYTEMKAEAQPEIVDKWVKDNSGKDWNAFKPVTGGAAGMPPAVTPGEGAAGAVHTF